MVPLPEDLAVLDNFVWRFSLHLLGDVVYLVPAILFVQPDKLVEVALGPIGKTLESKNKQ